MSPTLVGVDRNEIRSLDRARGCRTPQNRELNVEGVQRSFFKCTGEELGTIAEMSLCIVVVAKSLHSTMSVRLRHAVALITSKCRCGIDMIGPRLSSERYHMVTRHKTSMESRSCRDL
jgi:hypothetical protein